MTYSNLPRERIVYASAEHHVKTISNTIETAEKKPVSIKITTIEPVTREVKKFLGKKQVTQNEPVTKEVPIMFRAMTMHVSQKGNNPIFSPNFMDRNHGINYQYPNCNTAKANSERPPVTLSKQTTERNLWQFSPEHKFVHEAFGVDEHVAQAIAQDAKDFAELLGHDDHVDVLVLHPAIEKEEHSERWGNQKFFEQLHFTEKQLELNKENLKAAVAKVLHPTLKEAIEHHTAEYRFYDYLDAHGKRSTVVAVHSLGQAPGERGTEIVNRY